MTETVFTGDNLEMNDYDNKLPKTLNVLTILTFIGCGIIGIFTLLTPMITNFGLKALEKAGSAAGQDLSAKQVADIERSKGAMELMKANMRPVILVGLLGVILCLVGAIMMRKLKKDGFWIYVAGQVLPIVGTLVIMGTKYNTPLSYAFYIIPALFIFLYSQQRKYMK
jgi:hypothetical protein